jgi:hypothetical protein
MPCCFSILERSLGGNIVKRLRENGIEITNEIYRIIEEELRKYRLECYASKIKVRNLLLPVITSLYSSDELEKIEEEIYQAVLNKLKK